MSSKAMNLILNKVADLEDFFNTVQKWDKGFEVESQLYDAALFVLSGKEPDNPPAWFQLWKMSVPDDLSQLDRSILTSALMMIDAEMKVAQVQRSSRENWLHRLIHGKG